MIKKNIFLIIASAIASGGANFCNFSFFRAGRQSYDVEMWKNFLMVFFLCELSDKEHALCRNEHQFEHSSSLVHQMRAAVAATALANTQSGENLSFDYRNIFRNHAHTVKLCWDGVSFDSCHDLGECSVVWEIWLIATSHFIAAQWKVHLKALNGWITWVWWFEIR